MYYKDTEVARNCNVFNDHQALSRIIDARRGTGRLHENFVISDAKGESRIPEDQIAGVFLSRPGETRDRAARSRLPEQLASRRCLAAGGKKRFHVVCPRD